MSSRQFRCTATGILTVLFALPVSATAGEVGATPGSGGRSDEPIRAWRRPQLDRSADADPAELLAGEPQEPATGPTTESPSPTQDPPQPEPQPETPPERPAEGPDKTPAGGNPTGNQGEPAAVATEPSTTPTVVPEPVPLPAYSPAYRDYAGVVALANGWCSARPDSVRALELGPQGPGGLPWCVLELAKPGPVPPQERPTVFLIGGLDGLALAGGEAVLANVAEFLQDDTFANDVTVIAIPWASPFALERAFASDVDDGRDLSPFDDDHDGKVDEDGPDDLDGDGAVLSMLIEDPRGPWTRASDSRFLVPAGANDGVRYLLCREGRDDDGDGRFNEDPVGGVVLDRNFPLSRSGARLEPLEGVLPLSAPHARALADLALSRRTVIALFAQGNHGMLAAPGCVALDARELVVADDRSLYERVSDAFQVATGRRQKPYLPLHEARGACRGGSALDWFYAVERALAVEVAWWGPTVEFSGDVAAADARYRPGKSGGESDVTDGAGAKPHARGLGNGRPAPGESDRAWAAWLDNSKGGIGFVEWSPVDLENGVQAWVGGFESRTVVNPPVETLPRVLAGASGFTRQLLAGLPKLDVKVLSATRDGDVCRVRARVRNTGLLPTGLAARGASASTTSPRRPASTDAAAELTLELGLPAGAELFAGRQRVERARLLGGETSEEYEWVVLAPEGSTFTLTARAEWTPTVVREVKP